MKYSDLDDNNLYERLHVFYQSICPRNQFPQDSFWDWLYKEYGAVRIRKPGTESWHQSVYVEFTNPKKQTAFILRWS